MRKIYSSLLMLAMMMVSMVAKAQYTVTIDSDPIEDWVAGQVSFPATEIASALGLSDAAALEALVKNPNENGDLQGGNVYLKLSDGSKSNDYTGNTNEFWMNLAGVPQAYGDEGTSWFVGLEFEAAGSDEESGESWEDRINVYVGQMPKVFKKIYEASALKCVLYLVNGDKEVSFDVTQNVTAAEKTEVPEPTTSLNALEIVKDYTLTLSFKQGGEYEDKTCTATLDGLYEALGTTAAEFDAAAADMTYTQVMLADPILNGDGEETGEYKYTWSDELKRPEDAAGGGWFGRYSEYDEATGEEVTFPMNAPKAWSSGANTFYVQSITLAEGEYSIHSGQFSGTMNPGDEDFAYLYLIYGSKAARIKAVVEINAKQDEPDKVPLDEMEKVGELVIDATGVEKPKSGTFTIDLEAVAELLGCEPDDVKFNALADESTLSDEHTANNGGCWMTKEGYVVKWNTEGYAIYCEPDRNGVFTKFNYGFNDGAWAIGDEYDVKLYLNYGTKYYLVVLHTVIQERGGEFELKQVGYDEINVQLIPAEGGMWPSDIKTTIDLDYVKSVIGTANGELYSDKADENGVLKMTNSYTCTPYPGFWYGMTTYDGYIDNAGWGNNSVGFTYDNGVLTWYFPDRQVGENFLANIYLVNPETGNYVKFLLNITFVSEVGPEVEEVYKEENTETVTAESYDSDGYVIYNIDKEKLYEALGLDDETIEAATFSFAKTGSMFVNFESGDDALINADGYMTEDETKAVATAHFFTEDGQLQIQIDPMDIAFEKSDASLLMVRFAVNYEGKRALYIITFCSENSAVVGINGIAAQKTAAGIYSISGTHLAAPQKGLNIIRKADGNVSKVFVK